MIPLYDMLAIWGKRLWLPIMHVAMAAQLLFDAVPPHAAWAMQLYCSGPWHSPLQISAQLLPGSNSVAVIQMSHATSFSCPRHSPLHMFAELLPVAVMQMSHAS
jgi:hypothetical protein